MRTDGHTPLIGTNPVMIELQQEIERVARSDAKVLITGESGVGKELVAQRSIRRAARAERAFVAVNCAGIPETLLESELFGHVKGSFTGAYRDKPGKLEMADRGTIFLDEIGEMTAAHAGAAAAVSRDRRDPEGRRRPHQRPWSTCASSPRPTATCAR